jgi:TP901 family phage tail tape measure protein
MAIFIPLVTKFDPKGLQGAQRALANFQNFAVEVGRIAAAAIAGVAVIGVREAAQFETSFAKIQGLVGVTADEIGVLEDAAKKLGPQFGISANEAADALFYITSAGLRGAGATEVLEASLKGAAIGLGDTKTIADLATSAVNAYGEAQLGGAKAVDVLAEAVRLGKLEPAELAASMGDVLPLASALGVSFDQVGAAMAGMSKTGTDAATASTQLKGIFNTLISPTVEAKDALAGMGLSAEGLRDQVKDKGLLSVLQLLTDKFDGNLEATGAVFGNVRALTGVLDLMGASAEDNADIFALMADNTGVLDEAMAITAETSAFKFNQAMETSKGILLEIGSAILEQVNPYLDEFKKFMDENGPGIQEMFGIIFNAVQLVAGKLGEIGEAIMPTVVALFNNSVFQKNMERLGQSFEKLAGEVIRFIESDLGQFLLNLTSATVVGGISLLADQVDRLAAGLFFLNEAINLLTGKGTNAKFGQIADSFKAFFGIDLGGLVQGFIDVQVQQGGYGNGNRRAAGGPVSSGTSYLVGERGPEIFTPMSSGNIIPNSQLGSKTNINITVNAGMGANGRQLGEQIVSAIKKYERTSGPVFASA